MKPTQSLLLKILLVGAVYALLDWLSSYPAMQLPFALEAVWLPCGFLFAVIVRSPKREWPGLLAVSAVAGFIVNLFQSWTPIPALAFSLSNPVEVLLGGLIASKLLAGRRMDLSR